MLRRYFFIWAMVLFGCLHSAGQEDLRFYHIDTKGYRVKTVFRGADNLMWVGTSFGLFTLPQLESRNPDGYDRQHQRMRTGIDRIFEDSKGQLWMVTHGSGIMIYDPKTNACTADVAELLGKKNIHIDKNRDFSIYIENRRNCLIWQDHQLYALDLDDGNVRSILLEDNGEQVMKVESNRRAFAVLTTKNLYFFSLGSKVLIRREPLACEVKYETQLTMDETCNVWLSDNKIVQGYNYQAQKWMSSVAFPSHVSAIACGPGGKIWIGQENDGIYICDTDLQIRHHLEHMLGDANSIRDNQIYMLHYEKTSGAMWVAYSKGGISIYDKKQNCGMLYQVMDRQNPNAMTDVLSFAQTIDGKGLWMGLEDRGIFYRPLMEGRWEQVLGGASVSFLKTGSDGSLWAGLYKQGLLHMTIQGKREFYFKGESPYNIAFTPTGQVYVALQGKGVWRMDLTTGQIVDTHIWANFVFDLNYHQGRLHAVATKGYFVMDASGRWKKIRDGIFRHGCIDRQNYVYLLGDGNRALGLTIIDPQGGLVSLPSTLEKGLSRCATLDKSDNLWVVNGHKLVMLRHRQNNQVEWEYKVFNINPEGERIYYNPGAIHIDRMNQLWLGTDNGYQCINLNRLMEQKDRKSEEKPLAIGCISINDEILSPNKPLNGRVLITHDVGLTKSLNLKYNENNIVVECSRLFEERTPTDIYYYQLRGLSDTWQLVDNQTIVLSNLPPGEYQLFTKTQDALESHLLDISIAPPLWRSWWAYLIYLLIVISVAIGMLRYFRNKREYEMRLQQLALQQEQEKHLNEMKLRFFTNISHDLRTPLSLIIGPVEDLEGKAEDTATKSMLGLIHRNADLLLSLVNQILDFRRLEFGNEKVNLSYGDIVSTIGDICDTFRLKARKEGISLDFQPMVERVETQFDRDKMTKIIMNLLANAFKFTDRGGSITVSTDVLDGHVVIRVADTGIGISDEEKQLVFDRFYQSDNAHLQAIGSGIGLHIVREYVHLQGGEITIQDNEAGKGTVFCITLPLCQGTHEQEKEEESDETIPVEQNEPLHETTVLVVDDNSDFLTYVSQSLSGTYNVVSASNGENALEQLQENDVDIIISDVMMDGMDGLELCRMVKSDIATSHIPVILLTAKAQSTNELEGLEAGADDYITKPFSMSILLQRVHNLLERSRQQHQRFKNEIDIEPSEITVTSLDEQFITNAITQVEAHISDSDFNVEELSSAMGVHRSQLYKKLQHLTGRTPIQFIRLLRLKRGKQLLEKSGLYVSEIAYQVGFNSPRVFSKYFKAEFGMTPDEYKNKNGINNE